MVKDNLITKDKTSIDKYICDVCGSRIKRTSLSSHLKSKKHQTALNGIKKVPITKRKPKSTKLKTRRRTYKPYKPPPVSKNMSIGTSFQHIPFRILKLRALLSLINSKKEEYDY